MNSSTFSPCRVLNTWLAEFGYLNPHQSSPAIAFRIARAERGPKRLERELFHHEARLKARRVCRT